MVILNILLGLLALLGCIYLYLTSMHKNDLKDWMKRLHLLEQASNSNHIDYKSIFELMKTQQNTDNKTHTENLKVINKSHEDRGKFLEKLQKDIIAYKQATEDSLSDLRKRLDDQSILLKAQTKNLNEVIEIINTKE